ncbi:lectin-like domain-containing protein [Streptosporangium lutulentum]|uniref:Secreted protein n=1 Tax=Streptosporangium lutulentum TaxID=1461250 RepID=A0ABT9Q2G5_9ACTN|nr:hypothetical protein [Streptosporangium lutulentum]MDP9840925.1 hypothetical protein [Streptosporangium lutulentum]
MATLTATVAGIALVAPTPPASAAELYSELYAEGFHGASTPAGLWKSSSPESGRAPCLTAAVSPAPPGSLPACAEGPYDRAGRGALRLTDGTGPETASLLLARKIPTGRGLTVEFDMYMWGGRKYTDGNGSRAGDGISFYVVDAARKQATAGEPGGALGYRGLTGAFAGVGFDQFGNFSNPRWAGAGGPAGCPATGGNVCARPNSVVVRGSESAGYAYAAGSRLNHPLDTPEAGTRKYARRHVLVGIGADSRMDVLIRHHNDGPYETVISKLDLRRLPGQSALPDNVRIGFASSTGYATSVHEISNVEIRTRDADLVLRTGYGGPLTAGGTGTSFLDADAAPGYGWIDQPTEVTYHLPSGLTPTTASGDGWTCDTSGQWVTCDTSEEAAPGTSLPRITVLMNVAADASGTLTASGRAVQVTADPDAEIDPLNNTVAGTVTVAPAGPATGTATGPVACLGEGCPTL